MSENYYRITEEQELMRESLKEILERECPESYLQECYWKEEYPERFYKALHESGFSLLGIPEEYGGIECPPMTHILISETISRHGGPSNLFALMVDNILNFGSQEQIKTIMNITMTGRAPFCLGFTEPGAGSDSSAITTTATKKNGKVYINGQKTFISWALQTPYILCMTRDTDNPSPYKAMSMYLVPTDVKGLTMNKQQKLGMKLGSTAEIFFDNVEIPESALVGVEGNGFMQLMKNFELERLISCSVALGLAEACFESAATYANQRVQFKKRISDFQLTQLKITDMYAKIENMRNMIYKAAWDIEQGNSIRLISSVAKRYCSQSSFEVADDAMQILGGIGYCCDHKVARLWLDARGRRFAAGTDEVMVHNAGRAILKEYE